MQCQGEASQIILKTHVLSTVVQQIYRQRLDQRGLHAWEWMTTSGLSASHQLADPSAERAPPSQ